MLYDPKWEPTKTTTEEWRTLLLKAADLIEQKGWVSGTYGYNDGVCAVSAIAQVADIGWEVLGDRFAGKYQGPASEAVSNLLTHVNTRKRFFLFRRSHYGSVEKWNDAPRRTKEEVVNTMRKVANAV